MTTVEEGKNYQEQEPQAGISFIITDVDGVLVDTMAKYDDILSMPFPDPRDRAYFKNSMGDPTLKQIYAIEDYKFPRFRHETGILPSDGDSLQAEVAAQIDWMLAKAKGKPFPEVRGILQVLKNQKYKISASSAHPRERIERILKEGSLDQFFDFTVGKDAEHPTKGESHFRAIANHYRVPYEKFIRQAIFIDDGPRNIELSAATGVLTIGRSGTVSQEKLLQAGANFVVDNLSQLPELIAYINSLPH